MFKIHGNFNQADLVFSLIIIRIQFKGQVEPMILYNSLNLCRIGRLYMDKSSEFHPHAKKSRQQKKSNSFHFSGLDKEKGWNHGLSKILLPLIKRSRKTDLCIPRERLS